MPAKRTRKGRPGRRKRVKGKPSGWRKNPRMLPRFLGYPDTHPVSKRIAEMIGSQKGEMLRAGRIMWDEVNQLIEGGDIPSNIRNQPDRERWIRLVANRLKKRAAELREYFPSDLDSSVRLRLTASFLLADLKDDVFAGETAKTIIRRLEKPRPQKVETPTPILQKPISLPTPQIAEKPRPRQEKMKKTRPRKAAKPRPRAAPKRRIHSSVYSDLQGSREPEHKSAGIVGGTETPRDNLRKELARIMFAKRRPAKSKAGSLVETWRRARGVDYKSPELLLDYYDIKRKPELYGEMKRLLSKPGVMDIFSEQVHRPLVFGDNPFKKKVRGNFNPISNPREEVLDITSKMTKHVSKNHTGQNAKDLLKLSTLFSEAAKGPGISARLRPPTSPTGSRYKVTATKTNDKVGHGGNRAYFGDVKNSIKKKRKD